MNCVILLLLAKCGPVCGEITLRDGDDPFFGLQLMAFSASGNPLLKFLDPPLVSVSQELQ